MKIINETKNEDGTTTFDLELTEEEDKFVKELAEKYQCTESEAIERTIHWYLKEQQNEIDEEDVTDEVENGQ